MASPPHHLHGTNAVTVSTSPHRIVTFTRMHQVNADTGFARAIRRQTQHESVPVPLLLLLLLPRELSNARGYLMVCLLRFPFPDTWPTHSDNCMLVDVAGDTEEWNRAATLLTASVTDATLVQLQRCAVCLRVYAPCVTLTYPPPPCCALSSASKIDTSGSGITTPNACGVMPWARPI